MISLYRTFQIIFGLVVSMFILYFLIQYASNYAGFQGDVQKVTILRNLKTTSESVYAFGTPVTFPDTSMYDLSSCYMQTSEPDAPEMKCDFGEVGPVLVPTLLSLGKKEHVVVSGADLNFGWYVMHWIEIMPESAIIFTPMDSSDNTWNLMKNLTHILPSTENLDSKITFGFCDGTTLIENICGGKCERYEFLDVLESNRAPAAKCTASLPGEYSLITISSHCMIGYSDSGVCVLPSADDVGVAYLEGSDKEFVYKDSFDIISLVIGGDTKDVFDKTGGERLYEYKNKVWGDRLSLAASIMRQRALLIPSEYQTLGENQECVPIYSQLYATLGSVHGTVSGDYNNLNLMRSLSGMLSDARSLYQDLVNLGCEYRVQ
jgi:hypothetical protein